MKTLIHQRMLDISNTATTLTIGSDAHFAAYLPDYKNLEETAKLYESVHSPGWMLPVLYILQIAACGGLFYLASAALLRGFTRKRIPSKYPFVAMLFLLTNPFVWMTMFTLLPDSVGNAMELLVIAYALMEDKDKPGFYSPTIIDLNVFPDPVAQRKTVVDTVIFDKVFQIILFYDGKGSAGVVKEEVAFRIDDEDGSDIGRGHDLGFQDIEQRIAVDVVHFR